eukprot:3594286-Amphidinium_carterae.2
MSCTMLLEHQPVLASNVGGRHLLPAELHLSDLCRWTSYTLVRIIGDVKLLLDLTKLPHLPGRLPASCTYIPSAAVQSSSTPAAQPRAVRQVGKALKAQT